MNGASTSGVRMSNIHARAEPTLPDDTADCQAELSPDRPLDDVTTLGYVERRGNAREARRARSAGRRRSQEQRVRAVARPWARGDPCVRTGARSPDALRGRPRDRADPRRRATVPPDAGRPRLRTHQRQRVLLRTACARARVLLPVGHAAAGRRGTARRGRWSRRSRSRRRSSVLDGQDMVDIVRVPAEAHHDRRRCRSARASPRTRAPRDACCSHTSPRPSSTRSWRRATGPADRPHGHRCGTAPCAPRRHPREGVRARRPGGRGGCSDRWPCPFRDAGGTVIAAMNVLVVSPHG